MRVKKILSISLSLLLLLLCNCSSKNTNNVQKGNTNNKPTSMQNTLEEIDIEQGNFNNPNVDLTYWNLLFSVTPDGSGFGDRVKVYHSIEEFKNDTKANYAKLNREKGANELADIMASRVLEKVDFSKNELVVVNMSQGGPPFGKFNYTVKDNVIIFCITPPDNPGMIQGMALETIFKMYIAPKGMDAKMCEK